MKSVSVVTHKGSFLCHYCSDRISVVITQKRAMTLAGKQMLERFVDHIESNSGERKRWLARVREAGFDQALSEFRQTFECCSQIFHHPRLMGSNEAD